MKDEGTPTLPSSPLPPSPSFFSYRAVRGAVLFLLLFAAVRLIPTGAVTLVSSSYPSRSAMHLDREVERVRQQIANDEGHLDGELSRLASAMAAKPNAARPELFRIVAPHHGANNRGTRFLAPSGEAVAWGGEDLPVPGQASFEFDATNLYVLRTRVVANGTIQAFERIGNQQKARSFLDPDDDWIVATIFHAGRLRQEPGTRRALVERRPDATLWMDITPRTRTEVVESREGDGRDVAAILLALGALVTLALLRRGPPKSEAMRLLLTVLLI